MDANIVVARSVEEQIEGYGCHHVHQEPSFKVVQSHGPRPADHLPLVVDERRPEVDDDVHDEHDIDGRVRDGEDVGALLLRGLLDLLVQKESCHVGSAHGRVDDQYEDQPVPGSLERGVMQYCQPADLGLVLKLPVWRLNFVA